MPQVNLSTLNGRELRQLLDASRRRGDAALSYQILQEMAARRERPAERGPFMTLRPAEPRLIPVELADPMEHDDLPPMPNWRPPPRPPSDAAPSPPQAEAAPPPAPRRSRRKAPPEPVTPPKATASPDPVPAAAIPEPDPDPPPRLHDERPLTLRDFDPDPPLEEEATYMTTPGLSMQPVELGEPRTPRPRFRLVAGLALGAVLGLALGWLGGWLARDAMTRPAAPIQTALLTPAPIPPPPAPAPAPAAAAAPPAAEAAPEAPVAPIPQDADAAAAASPKAQEAVPAPAPVPDGAALELPAPGAEAEAAATAKAERSRLARDRSASTPAVAAGCAAQPTPADRQICGDPELRRLQGELRRAYNAALEAHEDRATLRQRQLAWRDARSDVTDPARLAKLYEDRIRKLNAATAQARRER